MDLSRGICSLCSNNTKIIVPSPAQKISSLIKEVFADKLNLKEFDLLNSSPKVCPFCLCDLLFVKNAKKRFNNTSSISSDCFLCDDDEQLVSITDWSHFDKILESATNKKRPKKSLSCLKCIKCLELFEKLRSNLLNKYPQLIPNFEHQKISTNKQEKGITWITPPELKVNRTPSPDKAKHKKCNLTKTKIIELNSSSDESLNDSFESEKSVNNLKVALKHLHTLRGSHFNYEKFKEDQKLLGQIPFVKLCVTDLYEETSYKKRMLKKKHNSSRRSINFDDTDSSNSPKHSFFKIKIKPSKLKTGGKIVKATLKKKAPKSKKELVIKILKMDLGKQTKNYESEIKLSKTPTKASQKMMPNDTSLSSKRRKSVCFVEDKTGFKEKSESGQLKLKENAKDLFKNGKNYSSDEDNLKKNKNKSSKKGDDSESEEEVDISKSYVEEIQKNNDNIFDSLKSSENKEMVVNKVRDKDCLIVNSSDEDSIEEGNSSGSINSNKKKNDEPKKVRDNKSKPKSIRDSESSSEEVNDEDNLKNVNDKPTKSDNVDISDLESNAESENDKITFKDYKRLLSLEESDNKQERDPDLNKKSDKLNKSIAADDSDSSIISNSENLLSTDKKIEENGKTKRKHSNSENLEESTSDSECQTSKKKKTNIDEVNKAETISKENVSGHNKPIDLNTSEVETSDESEKEKNIENTNISKVSETQISALISKYSSETKINTNKDQTLSDKACDSSIDNETVAEESKKIPLRRQSCNEEEKDPSAETDSEKIADVSVTSVMSKNSEEPVTDSASDETENLGVEKELESVDSSIDNFVVISDSEKDSNSENLNSPVK